MLFVRNTTKDPAQTYLQLPLQQWVASNVYLLVLSSRKVSNAETPIAIMGLQICSGLEPQIKQT